MLTATVYEMFARHKSNEHLFEESNEGVSSYVASDIMSKRPKHALSESWHSVEWCDSELFHKSLNTQPKKIKRRTKAEQERNNWIVDLESTNAGMCKEAGCL